MDGSGNDILAITEQGGDQTQRIVLEAFSKFVPLCIRRQILTQMVSDFPEPMKNRVRALKKLQFESTKLEAEFYKEVYSLECKYQEMYNELHERRTEIISGLHEPSGTEIQFELPDPQIDEKVKESKVYEAAKQKMSITDKHTNETRGIPDFWLQTFRNVYILNDLIEEHDEPAFRALQDIRVQYRKDPMGFLLEFHFARNEYFSNAILTKEYFMSCAPDENDPFSFDGPEIFKCKGCTIDWLPEKNLTTLPRVDVQPALPDMKGVKGQYLDSFFNFFSPPSPPAEGDEKQEEIMRRLTYDYEIAHYIRERIIPRAVLYFTGEGIESEDSDEDESEDEDETSYDDEDEEDSSPRKNNDNSN